MASPGNRVPTVTLYADQEEIKTAFEIATKAHVCRTCGKPFSILESMGALECWQHPGFLQDNGKWSCCGQRIHTPRWSDHKPVLKLYDNCQPPFECATVKGCQKCDHNTSDQPYTHKDAQSIADLSALLPFINKEMLVHKRRLILSTLLEDDLLSQFYFPGLFSLFLIHT